MQIVYDKHLGTEFQSEVRTLEQVEHLNLVKFHGYLEHGDERIIVVEHVPNGTLREQLDREFFLYLIEQFAVIFYDFILRLKFFIMFFLVSFCVI